MMILISDNIKDIGCLLNELRSNSYIDIYMETEFLSKGYLLDKDLYLYKYLDSLKFNENTHSFGNFIELYKSSNKIDYNSINNYLKNELKLDEKNYKDDREIELNTIEIIKLESSEYEFNNSILYKNIENKLLELLGSEK